MAGMIALRILAVTFLMVLAAGCGWRGMLTTPDPPAATAALSEATVPEWRPGDRWVYEWTSGQERGTRTIEVRESTAVNGVQYYVVDIGNSVQQYYTRDLHFAAGVEASKVLARMVPPQPWFVWPLKAAAQWNYQGVYEEPGGSKPQSDSFGVVGVELVTVPGGEFRAFKIVRQTDRRDSDQYWYAPEVRWYVRWLGRRGDVEFEEQLKAYQPTPRLTLTPSTR
jgi:hypothetical protein